MVSSILIGVFGLFSLSILDTDISVDGVPNKPQIERVWDQTKQIIAIVVLAAIIALYSGIRFFR